MRLVDGCDEFLAELVTDAVLRRVVHDELCHRVLDRVVQVRHDWLLSGRAPCGVRTSTARAEQGIATAYRVAVGDHDS